ncbi:MAG: transporter substrate-binding domain-containing protein [Cryomorphaceae bacterium]
MFRITTFFLVCFLCFTGCSSTSEKKALRESPEAKIAQRDLDVILASGKLVALTDFSSSSYFIFKGVPMGFEYELLQRFCDELGVDLSVRIVSDMDSVIYLLNRNKGDVIAANYTVTNRRKRKVSFSEPVLKTRQVLVQRLPEQWWTMTRDQLNQNLVRNAVGLVGKEVYVRRESSFYTRLLNLMDEMGGIIDIEFAEGIGTEQLIEMVSLGEINYTVADENVAVLNKAYFSNIDVNTPLSFTQNVAWACRKNSPLLLDTLNSWLNEFKHTEEFAVIHLKYFKARTQHRERVLSEYSSLKGSKISPYDVLIKQEAERIGWDWKLLAAMIYQESKFIPDAEAWTGASGLMQLIPETAQRFGADSVGDPQQNIHAGVSFLKTIDAYWKEKLNDSTQIIPFSLASYNVGLGHVLDARRLAKKHGGDTASWESVSTFLELKAQPQFYTDEVVRHGYCRGTEPVTYVRSIMSLWEHYKNTPI